ncbi:MAG: LytTR family transcriptional regulator DNA-binding domain-containing protein [Bacteroidota bacterium]
MIWKVLQAPYPAPSPSQRGFWLALGVGLFIALFLLIFKPFGLNVIPGPLADLKIIGYGLVTFVVVFAFQQLPRFFTQIQDQNWTVFKEILFIGVILLSITFGNVLYTQYIGSGAHFEVLLQSMFFNTFVLGVIPAAFVIVLNQRHLNRKYTGESQALPTPEPSPPSNPRPATIQVQLPQTQIEVSPDQLLYVESLGNYARLVSHHHTAGAQREVVRSTLKQLERELCSEHIIRCHRSFIVNLQRVEAVTGNAQGFKLQLRDTEQQVPVSRKYVPQVRHYFAATS